MRGKSKWELFKEEIKALWEIEWVRETIITIIFLWICITFDIRAPLWCIGRIRF